MMMPLLSHAIAALAFAAAALLLLVHWRGDRRGALLIAATGLTALWAGGFVWRGIGPVTGGWIVLAELARTVGWLIFVIALLRPMHAEGKWRRLLAACTVAAMITALGWVTLRYLWGEPGAAMSNHRADPVFSVLALVLAVLGMILLEQLLRSASPTTRASTRFLCLGVGIVLAFDVYLYSTTLLYAQASVAPEEARGLINALAVPLILIAARRNRDWQVPVFISRAAAFHTATMFIIGGYLLMLGVGGYYVRDFGGSWGRFAQITLTVAGLLLLVLLTTSVSLRRQLRVLLNKHFFTHKYDYREEWLRLTDYLAGERDQQNHYDRAIEAVANGVKSPGGILWRQHEGTFEPAGAWQIEPPSDAAIAGDDDLPAFLAKSQWIIDLAELRDAPERYHHLQLPACIAEVPRAWIIMPLIDQATLIGFILLIQPPMAGPIEWEDRDVLHTLGKQVASYLGQHENARALAQARQFDAFNQLTAFLMHDLKNLIAQQSLIVTNAERHQNNPAFVADAFATIGDSVKRMERILEAMQSRPNSHISERVEVDPLLETVAARKNGSAPMASLELNATGAVIETDREAFSMVVSHLLSNARDATPAQGLICLTSSFTDDWITITLMDTGAGMSEAFVRDKLFEPFHTTKRGKGMGIGAHQAREFARRQGGQLTVKSEEGQGTVFCLTLPCPERRVS